LCGYLLIVATAHKGADVDMLPQCQHGVALRSNLSSIRGYLSQMFIASFGIMDARPELADSREWIMRAAFSGALSSDTIGYLLREFTPDMKRLFRKHAPKKILEIENKVPIPADDKL
jgi:hypothetical protein